MVVGLIIIDVQNESELEPLYDRHVCLTEYQGVFIAKLRRIPFSCYTLMNWEKCQIFSRNQFRIPELLFMAKQNSKITIESIIVILFG